MDRRIPHSTARRRALPHSPAFSNGLTALAVSLLLAFGLPSPSAQAQEAPVQVSIAAQPLGSALVLLANQYALELAYSPATVAGLNAPAVSGQLTADQALQQLLAGTGIEFKRSGKNVSLSKPGQSPVEQLPAISVVGNALERAWGPVDGYAAQRSASATKTDTPLLETPQSISVISRAQVQAQNVQNLVQAAQYTPGVQTSIDPVDNRFDSLRIRGFAPTIFLDGMPLPSGSTGYGEPKVDPYILERIEILRGPSSALYGAVPPGGLVNLVSLRPPETPVHSVQLQANTYGRAETAFDFGGPVDDDGKLSYRLTGLGYGGGTQIDHTKESRALIAPSLTLRPDADTTLTLLGEYQRDNSGVQIQFLPAYGTLLNNPNGTVPYGKNVGEPDYDHYSRTQAWAGYDFEHRFNDTTKVRQKLRYVDIDTDVRAIIGAGLQPDMRTLNRQNFHVPEATQSLMMDNDLEFNFKTGQVAHTALLGLDYHWASSDTQQGFGSAPAIDLFNTRYGAPVATPASSSSSSQNQNQLGLYLQDQLAYEHWRLTLSGRHDWVDTRTTNRIANTSQSQEEGAFSGRAGLNYVFDSGISPYVAYSRSFQPVIGTAFDSTPFNATSGQQYEAGVKYQPPGRDISMTAAAFTLTQENALTVDTEHPLFQTQAGQVRSRGIELQAIGKITPDVNLVAAYTYTNASVTKSNGTDLGKQVIATPRHQASLWVDYTVPGGALRTLSLGAGMHYFGRSYGNAANTIGIPSNTLVDLAISYDLGALNARLKGARVSLAVNNLFDRRYVATCASLSQCYYGTSRVAMATLRYDW
ncbi:MAG TPA: TonB-dependent siderophore receptor [Bordetella sp.]